MAGARNTVGSLMTVQMSKEEKGQERKAGRKLGVREKLSCGR